MSDQDIKTLLQTMADDVPDAQPLTRSALRRTRTRRVALAAATVMSVVSLAVAGTGLALTSGGPGGGGSIQPAGNDSTPPPPNPMPGDLVAHGSSGDGGEWWLSAEAADSGEICVYLQHETGDVEQDCRSYTENPNRMHFAGDGIKDGVYGWVPDNTDTAWVTRTVEMVDGGPEDEESEESEAEESEDEGQGGESSQEDDSPDKGGNVDVTFEGEEEVELHDAPEGFPYPVSFYALVPAPENAETFLIKTDGHQVALIFGRIHEASDGQSNGWMFVAKGEHGGYPWDLYEKVNDDGLRCLDLIWAGERFGSGGGCSTAVPDDESFQYSMLRFEDEHGIAFFAAVSEDVETLEIVRDDGEVITFEVIEGPDGSDVNYVVAWPSLDEDGRLQASARTTDADGHTLDTMRLCELGGAGSSCSSDYRP